MSKSDLTHYLSNSTASVGPMVRVLCQCHASVSRKYLLTVKDFPLECIGTLTPNTSLAKFYMPPRMTPAELFRQMLLI